MLVAGLRRRRRRLLLLPRPRRRRVELIRSSSVRSMAVVVHRAQLIKTVSWKYLTGEATLSILAGGVFCLLLRPLGYFLFGWALSAAGGFSSKLVSNF